jgi:hypothetical protein
MSAIAPDRDRDNDNDGSSNNNDSSDNNDNDTSPNTASSRNKSDKRSMADGRKGRAGVVTHRVQQRQQRVRGEHSGQRQRQGLHNLPEVVDVAR